MKKIFSCIVVALSISLTSTYGLSESNLNYFFGATEYKNVEVEEVISADTIKLVTGEKIRLIGLRAPTVPKSARKEVERDEYGFPVEEAPGPETPIEMRSYFFARKLLEGKRVRLEFDQEKKDDELYTVAYVFLLKDNVFANTEILKQGFADLHMTALNTKYAEELREAYKEAKKENRGLHDH